MNNLATTLPNETALVAQAKTDTTVFARIYDHYFDRVYNYIRYRIQDIQATDDITAQVFERALTQHLNRCQPKNPSILPTRV